jgi:hypothetical protein
MEQFKFMTRLTWFLLGFVAVASMACGPNGNLTSRSARGANGKILVPEGSTGSLKAAEVLVQWNTSKQSGGMTDANFSEFSLEQQSQLDALNQKVSASSALKTTLDTVLAKHKSQMKETIRQISILSDAYSAQLVIGVQEIVQNPNIQSSFGMGLAILLNTTTAAVINTCASQLGLSSNQSNWGYGYVDVNSVLLPIADLSPIQAMGAGTSADRIGNTNAAQAGADQLANMMASQLVELQSCVAIQTLEIETY